MSTDQNTTSRGDLKMNHDKHYCERRNERGELIERVGPFLTGSAELQQALQHQAAIAEVHNGVRRPGSFGGGGSQLVTVVIEARRFPA